MLSRSFKSGKKDSKIKNDNRGLSLVELLVAFAVSAIVLSGLAYLMINVLNLFGRTNVNVELQNES